MKNLLAILIVLSFTLTGNTLTASTLGHPINPELMEQEGSSVFVHITAQLVKKTPKGAIIEITAIKAVKKNSPLRKNQLKATMQLKGNQLGIQLENNERKIARIKMPEGFKIPPSIAQKLGASQSVVMSGGSTMLQPQSLSMLWFEIQ
ncbi:MAG: hypothetical protein Sapg2KO_44670 [Saprospiraceae bacterium]